MRRFVQACYRILLRGIGALGLLLLITFAMVVVAGLDTRGFLHALPLLALGFLTASSLALFGAQRHLPDALVRPHRPIHLVALMPAFALATCITPIAVMITLTGFGQDADLMRSLSVGTAALFGLAYMGAGLLGLLLALWTPPDGADRPARARPARANPFDRIHAG